MVVTQRPVKAEFVRPKAEIAANSDLRVVVGTELAEWSVGAVTPSVRSIGLEKAAEMGVAIWRRKTVDYIFSGE